MRRRLCISLILLGLHLLAAPLWAAALSVVVHPENPLTQLSRDEVVDIYMGRRFDFPDGTMALPLDLPPEAFSREQFYRLLVDKSVPQVNAYWARLFFTGRATPPRVMPSEAALLAVVGKNRDALAYIDSALVDTSVKVVFQLGAP